MPTTTWCWYCRRIIPPDAGECPHCGKALDNGHRVIRCPKCGGYVMKAAQVCGSCGELIHSAPPGPPPAVREDLQAPKAGPTPQQSDQQPKPDIQTKTETPEDAPGEEQPASETAVQGENAPEASEAAENAEQPAEEAAADRESPSQTDGALKKLSAEKNSGKKSMAPLVLVLLAVLLIGGVFVVSRYTGKRIPKACREGNHKWVEADCVNPRFCPLCGETEGEPLGHSFEENRCVVCGTYNKPLYFSDYESSRDGNTVTFKGNVRNDSGALIRDLELTVCLYDTHKKLVSLKAFYPLDGELAPGQNEAWSYSFDDSAIPWRYWRIAASDYVRPDGSHAAADAEASASE